MPLPLVFAPMLLLAALSPTPAPVPQIALPIRPGGPLEPALRLVDAEIRVDRQLLWRGTLRVASGTSASYSQIVQQAPAPACGQSPSRTSIETSIRLNLNGYWPGTPDATPMLNYSLEWIRPGPCPGGPAQLSVRLNGQLPALAKRAQTISGDAGMELRLAVR